MHVLYTYGVALMAALAQPGRAQQEAPSDDPIPDPTAAVALGNARFTVLSESLIRLQSVTPRRDGHQQQPDDRATAVVVNRRFPGGVPKFSVSHPNASAVVITTAKLQLTYSLPASRAPPTAHSAHAGVDVAQDGVCGCNETDCASADHSISWQIHHHTQGADGHRTPGCPNGLTNQTLGSCFCACTADPDCEAITYAPAGEDLALSCWLLTGVSKTTSVGDRTFVGMTQGGFAGFNDANLQIDFLDPTAPISVWRPSNDANANLNGSYPALDCYTVPAKCAAQNAAKMQKGLLSRDGWALWDDIGSQRMVASNTSEWSQWHAKNSRQAADAADLYFFGHGLDYKAALQDFRYLSGPAGILSAPDYGVWWSNSFTFTKEQFLNRLIANFTKHELPFTHLVMDLGWHQVCRIP